MRKTALIAVGCLFCWAGCNRGASSDDSGDSAPSVETRGDLVADASIGDLLDLGFYTPGDQVGDSAPETAADTTMDITSDGPPVDSAVDWAADEGSPDIPDQKPPVVWPLPAGTVGGDRPAPVWIPSDYSAEQNWPLVLLLHGFGVNGFLQNGLFHLSPQVDDLGILLVVPEGIMNQDGEQFWDAGWCCNWDHQPVDDVAYLISLVDEMATQYNVDPGRVYAMGHSNGGFMAYRLACDAGDRFTAIMSLAGAQFKDPIECTPTHSVGVLQVHGTEDKNVPYEGGNHYLSAWDSANYWAAHNGCGDPVEGTIMNLDAELEGPETVPTEWNGCPGSLRVALWSMEGIAHTPGIYNGTFAQLAVKFLLSQSKP